jgi:hypothetical protein
MTEDFIRTGGGSKNLTVRTVRYDALCYQLWSNSSAHIKTIIDKSILNVKTCKEAVESEKKAPDRMFSLEKYHVNFCHECRGLGKIFTGGEV